IGFGLYFLLSAFKKTSQHWLADAGPMADFLQNNLPQAEAFYRPFLERTVLPHADTFADLVTMGEGVAGVSLTLGLLTRLGALTSIVLLLNIMLSKGIVPALMAPVTSTDYLFVLAGLACLVGSAGLVWGLDGAFRRTFAANPVTRWLAGIPRQRTIVV